VSVGQNGAVTTVTGGTSTTVATLSLAKFPNDQGLQRVSGNRFVSSNNSGTATVAAPGNSGLGLITPGAIEMSNVDLAQEFTNMITAQRGFQANSRVISAADEMLQELVNLKR
jgi:flagellar hook protein FlgE